MSIRGSVYVRVFGVCARARKRGDKQLVPTISTERDTSRRRRRTVSRIIALSIRCRLLSSSNFRRTTQTSFFFLFFPFFFGSPRCVDDIFSHLSCVLHRRKLDNRNFISRVTQKIRCRVDRHNFFVEKFFTALQSRSIIFFNLHANN